MMRRPMISDPDFRTAERQGTGQWYGCLALLLGLLLTACTSMPLTPIAAEPTGHRQKGQVVWHDLLTDDVDAAKQFYGQLFGWTFQQHEGYTLVLNNGVPIAGIVKNTGAEKESRRGCWVICLSVEDVDEYARMVQEKGGKVIQKPAKMINRGRYSIISDPQGASLVLLRSATGDPVPDEPSLGGWLWDELWTSDTDSALAFYQPLGGYTALQLPPDEEEDFYWILMTDEQWQAGVTTVPFEDVPPQWVPVIRVADPVAVADRVPSLGGRVLVKSEHLANDAGIALIEDPTGGIVMVQSWPQEESPDKEK